MIILSQSCFFNLWFPFYLKYLDYVANVKSVIQHPCLHFLSYKKRTEIQMELCFSQYFLKKCVCSPTLFQMPVMRINQSTDETVNNQSQFIVHKLG